MTFLFTDIEGSTILMRRVGEDIYAQVLAEHHALIRSALAAHGGCELTVMGDGFFAAFTSSRECVAAVLGMQQALEAHSWPGGEHVRVRMGVHTGEAEQTMVGPVGLDVHRAARIAAAAHGGQVVLSETAAGLVRDSLPDAVALIDLGVHRLRDMRRPDRLFQLTAPGLQAEFPPPRSFGRNSELKDVGTLAESTRPVTVTAAGGSGTGATRLAPQAVSAVRPGSCAGCRPVHRTRRRGPAMPVRCRASAA